MAEYINQKSPFWSLQIFGLLQPPQTVSSGTISLSTIAMFSSAAGTTTPNSMTWDAYVEPGTWKTNLAYYKTSASGNFKVEYSLDDGTTWTTLHASIDGYSAAPTYAQIQSSTFAVTRRGKFKFRVTTLGTKNGASSSYYAIVVTAQLMRTA